ncbi:MAG: hypothetical protein OQL09_09555 [Gammaproteobacteria bacterium]|nr:hypothetical protein [Gammaproteobacteria bacterium]
MQSSHKHQLVSNLALRDVSSTARLFNFNRPVFMTNTVWQDCVALKELKGRVVDELAVLQRLRHVLFMASSALQGCVRNMECEFRIHRVSNDDGVRHPEPTTLKLVAHNNNFNQPVITIRLPEE